MSMNKGKTTFGQPVASAASLVELKRTKKQTEASILVASANSMAGELLAGALNRHSDFRVVANVTTVQLVLQSAQSRDLDVALINATLANGPLSGFEALRLLRECRPEVKSVILFDIHDPLLVVDARQVVHLLAEGMQNREIARELNLSEHTVKNYLFHIFDKLGVSSRVELVLYSVSSASRMQITSVRRDGQDNEEAVVAVIACQDHKTPNQQNTSDVSQEIRGLTLASDLLCKVTVPTQSVH